VKEGVRGTMLIAVKEKAKEGRANERARKLLAEFLSVPLKNVMIIKGSEQPAKILRVYAP
jgi:uncharacterized protein YggU (UPF0235/DUF167 family)